MRDPVGSSNRSSRRNACRVAQSAGDDFYSSPNFRGLVARAQYGGEVDFTFSDSHAHRREGG